MPNIMVRRDIKFTYEGFLNVAWGIRTRGSEGGLSDRLGLLYSLRQQAGLPEPIRYSPIVTHEYSVFALGIEMQMRFDRNLWEQKDPRPLVPARIALQFKAASDFHAVRLIQMAITRLEQNQLRHDHADDWKSAIPGATDILSVQRALRASNKNRVNVGNASGSEGEAMTTARLGERPMISYPKWWQLRK